MIDYLLKSAICLTVLLAVYYLFLEREKMHGFNRFFLLFSLVFGLLAPVLNIEVPVSELPVLPIYSATEPVVQLQSIPTKINTADHIRQGNGVSYLPICILFVYGLVVIVLLFRFAKNLVKIVSQISNNPKLSVRNASLVLLPSQILPYSFLNFIFLNEKDYKYRKIEDQLLTHELTHVRQLHSIDILFVEMLRILFWFNPVFNSYKRAIQLNHEFLADEAVLASYSDVFAYQNLLLEKAISEKSLRLTSNLNHSVTKKRLDMMVKKSSSFRKWLVQLILIPVVLVILFCVSVKAISETAYIKANIFVKPPVAEQKESGRDSRLKGATIWLRNEEGQYIAHKYDAMTSVERSALPTLYVFRGLIPTEEMLSLWRVDSTYDIKLDGKRIGNNQLANYKFSDFYGYMDRRLRDTTRENISHQIELTTNAYHALVRLRQVSKPKILWAYKSKSDEWLSEFPPGLLFQPPHIETTKKAYFKGATIWQRDEEGKNVPKRIDDMTHEERAALPPVPAPAPRRLPSDKMLREWQLNPGTFTIWLDNKLIKNSELANYKPVDFAYYGTIASYKDGTDQTNRVDLYTVSYYEDHYLISWNRANKNLSVNKGEIHDHEIAYPGIKYYVALMSGLIKEYRPLR